MLKVNTDYIFGTKTLRIEYRVTKSYTQPVFVIQLDDGKNKASIAIYAEWVMTLGLVDAVHSRMLTIRSLPQMKFAVNVLEALKQLSANK